LSYWNKTHCDKIVLLVWNQQADIVRTSQKFLNSTFTGSRDILNGKGLLTCYIWMAYQT